jgi:hypothetical protein
VFTSIAANRLLTARVCASDYALSSRRLTERGFWLDFLTWSDFFKKAETRDLLCLVTVAYRFFAQQSYVGEMLSRNWLRGVEQIFAEENLHYRVDARGGVHFRFDEEFARATAAAISILQKQRYANSLDAFSRSLTALAEWPPDGSFNHFGAGSMPPMAIGTKRANRTPWHSRRRRSPFILRALAQPICVGSPSLTRPHQSKGQLQSPRRFPPPWTPEVTPNCYIVRDG